MSKEAERAGSWEYRAEGLCHLVVDNLRLGRFGDALAQIWQYGHVAEITGRPIFRYVHASLGSLLALWEGRFARAEEQIARMQVFGEPLPQETVQQVTHGQMAWLARERGEIVDVGELVDTFANTMERANDMYVWHAGLALIFCETNNPGEAATLVDMIWVWFF